jgi:hypothetical protein
VRKQKVSEDIMECNEDRDVPELPCPACIEVAAEKNRGLVPENALQIYNYYQLKTPLENNVHNQKEFISVALKVSIHLYRTDSDNGFRKIGL